MSRDSVFIIFYLQVSTDKLTLLNKSLRDSNKEEEEKKNTCHKYFPEPIKWKFKHNVYSCHKLNKLYNYVFNIFRKKNKIPINNRFDNTCYMYTRPKMPPPSHGSISPCTGPNHSSIQLNNIYIQKCQIYSAFISLMKF